MKAFFLFFSSGGARFSAKQGAGNGIYGNLSLERGRGRESTNETSTYLVSSSPVHWGLAG